MARRIMSFMVLRSHKNSASSACRMLRAESSSRALTALRTCSATAVSMTWLETARAIGANEVDMVKWQTGAQCIF